MKHPLHRLLRLRDQQQQIARREVERNRRDREAVHHAVTRLRDDAPRDRPRDLAELLHEEALAEQLGRSAALLAAEEGALRDRLQGRAREHRQVEKLIARDDATAAAAARVREAAQAEAWQRSRRRT